MKSLLKIFVVLFAVTMSTLFKPPKASAQVAVNFQFFYDQLSPYGSWVNYPDYGYAWVPNAGPGFSPYATAGHWVFTEYGWTWLSDYSWGWAPFHYGRWTYDPYYGWVWIPDNVWGPAWVVWRSSPGYYGWAPLRPGISINIAFGSGYYCPNDWWVFVPGQYVNSPYVYNYYTPRSNNVTIVNNTTIVNTTYVDNSQHTTYVYGPNRDNVQRSTGTTIRPVAIKNSDRPGQSLSDGQLRMYRPRVEEKTAGGYEPAPKKVVSMKDVKKVDPKYAATPYHSGNTGRNAVTQQPTENGNSYRAKDPVTAQPKNENQQKKPVQQQPSKMTTVPDTRKPQATSPKNAVPEKHNQVEKQQQPKSQAPSYNNSRPSPELSRSQPSENKIDRQQPATRPTPATTPMTGNTSRISPAQSQPQVKQETKNYSQQSQRVSPPQNRSEKQTKRESGHR